jgi:hypothetical protein
MSIINANWFFIQMMLFSDILIVWYYLLLNKQRLLKNWINQVKKGRSYIISSIIALGSSKNSVCEATE